MLRLRMMVLGLGKVTPAGEECLWPPGQGKDWILHWERGWVGKAVRGSKMLILLYGVRRMLTVGLL